MERTDIFAILIQFYFQVFENIYQFRQGLKKSSPSLIMVIKDSDNYFKEIRNWLITMVTYYTSIKEKTSCKHFLTELALVLNGHKQSRGGIL